MTSDRKSCQIIKAANVILNRTEIGCMLNRTLFFGCRNQGLYHSGATGTRGLLPTCGVVGILHLILLVYGAAGRYSYSILGGFFNLVIR